MSKPKVLVLGGVGFIGRNFVKYLVDNDLASEIRVLDKVLPITAFLSAEHKAAFDSPLVQWKQANLSSPASIAKNFAPTDGDSTWDFVFNLAAETKYGQTEEVYKEKVLEVAQKCMAEAVKIGVKRWVEISTAQVYDSGKGKTPAKETSTIAPWTKLAQFKYEAEKHLASTGLKYAILRPAIVYGPGDTSGLAPRVIVGAVYKKLGEKQKLLWTAGLQVNTVHIADVCSAMWLAATKMDSGSVYNLCDKGNTDQGKINKFLEAVFGIKTGFLGQIASNLVKTVSLRAVAEEANDKHLKPWSDLCKEQGIASTPLSPYIDQELLRNNPLFIDGSAIEKLGFKYQYPEFTKEHMQEIMGYFQKQGLFPKF